MVEIRVIIYTGKGGVGKTSVAAATALRLAKRGYKTIILSTDAAHSLSDCLEMPLSGEIMKIEENLDAIEIDVQYEIENKWSEIQGYIAQFLESQGIEPITAKELAVFPGMEFMSALFYVDQFEKTGEYDMVIFDTAPTADTIRLLSYPDVANWYFERIFGVMRNLIKIARMTVGRVMKMPMPSDKVLKDFDLIRKRLTEVKEIMTDPEKTSVRLVVNPEKMVITETMRAYTYLSLYGYTVEAIIINRIFPPDSGDGYFKEKLKEQKEHLKLIEEAFFPLKMLRANIFPKEIIGRKSLELLADTLFGDIDPATVFSTDKPMKMFEEDGRLVLALKIPFRVDPKKSVELFTRKDLLIVKYGGHKRMITLPHSYTILEPDGAEFANGWLNIYFTEAGENGAGSDEEGS